MNVEQLRQEIANPWRRCPCRSCPPGRHRGRSWVALIYVGATHLLPRAEREPKRYSLVALSAGTLTAVAIVLSQD